MSYPCLVVNLTYTPPGDIEGEPEQVRELSLQQIAEAAAQFGTLTEQTITQLGAAGLDRHETLAAWLLSPEGKYASELSTRIADILEITRRLQQAE
jgi:hypothetical protein